MTRKSTVPLDANKVWASPPIFSFIQDVLYTHKKFHQNQAAVTADFLVLSCPKWTGDRLYDFIGLWINIISMANS